MDYFRVCLNLNSGGENVYQNLGFDFADFCPKIEPKKK